MGSTYPTSLDSIALPVFTGGAPTAALGQAGRTAESLITDFKDSIEAIQASLGTVSAPGPLMSNVAVQGINVKSPQFGAVGNGVADDSTAILTAVTTAVTLGAEVYVPPGDYLLNSAAAASSLNSARFGLQGAGVGVTRFVVPASNTTGGLLFDATGAPHDAEIHLSDFSIVTRGVGTGTGLKVAMDPGGNQHNRSVTIERVRVYGEDPASHCFDIGIDVRSTWRPYLRDVTVGGPFGTGVTDNMTDASPQYVPTAALVLDDAYAWHIEGCNFWSAKTGIRDIGTTSEGGRLINTQIVGVKVALDRQRTGPEPSLIVQGCHWNYRDTGLNIDGGKLIRIIGNHPYCQDIANDYSGTSRDIWIKNSERNVILGNCFQFPGVADRINIHIDGAVMARDMIIDDNIFGSGGANAVLVGAGSSGIEVTPTNLYPGTYTKTVLDNSATVGDVWRLENQGAGSVHGPDSELYRNSVSPASSDSIGRVSLTGNDSAGNKTEFAALQGVINDPTDTAEKGALEVWAQAAGAMTKVAQFQDVGATDSTGMWLLTRHGGTVQYQRVTLYPLVSGGPYALVVAGP